MLRKSVVVIFLFCHKISSGGGRRNPVFPADESVSKIQFFALKNTGEKWTMTKEKESGNKKAAAKRM